MAVAARWDILKSTSIWAKRGVSSVPIAAGSYVLREGAHAPARTPIEDSGQ